MVAIKNMEMPKDCKKCPLMGTDGNPKDLFSPMMCIAIWATTHEIKHCVEGKILDDCPLVETEEHKAGKWLGEEEGYYSECSCCGVSFLWEDYKCIGDWRYCPNCGAEIRGE